MNSLQRRLDWLNEAQTFSSLLNGPALIRWNTDKRYVGRSREDVNCVPTAFVEPADRYSASSIAERKGGHLQS